MSRKKWSNLTNDEKVEALTVGLMNNQAMLDEAQGQVKKPTFDKFVTFGEECLELLESADAGTIVPFDDDWFALGKGENGGLNLYVGEFPNGKIEFTEGKFEANSAVSLHSELKDDRKRRVIIPTLRVALYAMLLKRSEIELGKLDKTVPVAAKENKTSDDKVKQIEDLQAQRKAGKLTNLEYAKAVQAVHKA